MSLGTASSKPITVVVLGGYGNFGAVISRALVRTPNLDVVVAGRDYSKAQALATHIGARPAEVNVNGKNLAEQLTALGTRMVISTVGPFQGQDYHVAQAAIDAKAHYADLADARDFVCGIGVVNEAAVRSDVLVTSGASSVPALSGAVIDRLTPRFSQIESIHDGISSPAKIPGPATVAALMGYCGKPFRQWRDGKWDTAYGWQEVTPHDFTAPLGRRWVGACDVPDLELFPARYPGVRTVRFSAGVGLRIEQFGIWALSGLVRARLLPNAAMLAGPLRRAGIWLEPLGDGLSGMFVELKGTGHDGKPLQLTWELVASQNHGPNIPCMAAVALARKLAAGRLTARGAMPCVGLVSLDEYLAELKDFDIRVTLKE